MRIRKLFRTLFGPSKMSLFRSYAVFFRISLYKSEGKSFISLYRFVMIALVLGTGYRQMSASGVVHQGHAVVKACRSLPANITEYFEVLSRGIQVRSLADCAGKCQRTVPCVGTVYWVIHDVQNCTLIQKRTQKVGK